MMKLTSLLVVVLLFGTIYFVNSATVQCIRSANVLEEEGLEDIEAVQPQEDKVEAYINTLAETEEAETEFFSSSIFSKIIAAIKKIVEKIKADLEKKRDLENSACRDKFVCEFECKDVMPTCTSTKTGYFDLTSRINSDTQEKIAYDW